MTINKRDRSPNSNRRLTGGGQYAMPEDYTWDWTITTHTPDSLGVLIGLCSILIMFLVFRHADTLEKHMALTQTDLDQLYAQAQTYQEVIDEIHRVGEEYEGELEFFEEELTNVNTQITKLNVEANDGWMPF